MGLWALMFLVKWLKWQVFTTQNNFFSHVLIHSPIVFQPCGWRGNFFQKEVTIPIPSPKLVLIYRWLQASLRCFSKTIINHEISSFPRSPPWTSTSPKGIPQMGFPSSHIRQAISLQQGTIIFTYPMVMTNIAIENGDLAIEIVSFPTQKWWILKNS